MLEGPSEPLRHAADFLEGLRQPSKESRSPNRTLHVERNGEKLRVTDGSERVIGARTMDDFLLLLLKYFTQIFLDFLPESTVAIHSSGLWRNRSALLMTGERESGKSTAVATLLRPKDTYLSDELLGLDSRKQTIYPYPRPINLDPDVQPPGEFSTHHLENSEGEQFRFLQPPDAAITTKPLPVDALGLIELERGTSPARFKAVAPGERFETLTDQTLRPVDPDRRFHSLSDLIRLADDFRRLKYEDIESVTAELRQRLETES